ncbi:MAG: hypothetical protein ACKO8G_00035 [Actinomycetota bacterium]
MEPLAAALEVLGEADGPLHWTVIQDRALRSGRLDPFADPDVRRHLLAALAEGVRAGSIVKVSTGTYALP